MGGPYWSWLVEASAAARWSSGVCTDNRKYIHMRAGIQFGTSFPLFSDKGVSHVTLTSSHQSVLSLHLSCIRELIKQVMQLSIFFKAEHQRKKTLAELCARSLLTMSWCLHKAPKHLKWDFGCRVQASWGNPGHCSVKWAPVVSSKCKGLCISLVGTAWSTLLFPLSRSHRIIWLSVWDAVQSGFKNKNK